ncbi:MAG: hypothetical protein ACSW8F_01395 [bacterium]
MKKIISSIIFSVIAFVWAISPDPFPVFIDDVIAALAGVISLIQALREVVKKIS